jgi:hypothetical protein
VLLRDAAMIWAINVVTFAVWYWEIDSGGPAKRHRDFHQSKDFLFPQMQKDGKPVRIGLLISWITSSWHSTRARLSAPRTPPS